MAPSIGDSLKDWWDGRANQRLAKAFVASNKKVDLRLYYFVNGSAILKIHAPIYNDAITIVDYFDGTKLCHTKSAQRIVEVIEKFFNISIGTPLIEKVQRLQPNSVLIIDESGGTRTARL